MTETKQSRIQSFAFIISIVICALLSITFIALSVASFGAPAGECKIALDEKINPNDAPLASLVRLSGIGIGKASTIVAYRENFGRKDSGSRAFQNCDDLQKVKGIGPKTVENISQWLKFE